MGFPPDRVDVTLDTTGADRRRRKRARRPDDRRASRNAGFGRRDAARRARTVRSVRRSCAAVRDAGRNARRRMARTSPASATAALRDYILGSTIVLADGTIARAGGMVVKNVAGYDMSRLYVGSFGTLGVLVQANLKTIAIAAARSSLSRAAARTDARARMWPACRPRYSACSGFLGRRISPRDRR